MDKNPGLSRRHFLRAGAVGAAVAASGILWARTSAAQAAGPARRVFPLDDDWLFGGRFREDALAPGFADASFARVTIPHCVAKLSWQKWQPEAWETEWIYRRHFTLPESFQKQ